MSLITLLPFGAGNALAMAFGVALQPALIIGVALSATSVSITAATLREFGRLNTLAGGAILAAAVMDDVIDDVIDLALLALVTGTSGESGASGPLTALVTTPISPPLLKLAFAPTPPPARRAPSRAGWRKPSRRSKARPRWPRRRWIDRVFAYFAHA